MGLFDFAFGFSNNNAQTGLNKWDTDWLYQQQSDRWRSNTDWLNNYGYSQMKAGLMRAGYNPLMALGATPQSGATVSGAVMDERTNASSFNSSGIPMNLDVYDAQMRNVNADTNLKNAQAEENMSRSSLEDIEKLIKDKQLPYEDRRQAQEVLGLQIDNMEKKARIENTNADTELKRSQTQLNSAQISEIRQRVSLLESEGVISAKRAKWLREHPEQAMAVVGIGEWTGALGKIFGGNVGFSKNIK